MIAIQQFHLIKKPIIIQYPRVIIIHSIIFNWKSLKIISIQTFNPHECNICKLSRVLTDQVDRQCIALTEISQGIKTTTLLPVRCVHECKSVDTMSEQQRKFNPPRKLCGNFQLDCFTTQRFRSSRY